MEKNGGSMGKNHAFDLIFSLLKTKGEGIDLTELSLITFISKQSEAREAIL
jgi:hypothetical protein